MIGSVRLPPLAVGTGCGRVPVATARSLRHGSRTAARRSGPAPGTHRAGSAWNSVDEDGPGQPHYAGERDAIVLQNHAGGLVCEIEPRKDWVCERGVDRNACAEARGVTSCRGPHRQERCDPGLRHLRHELDGAATVHGSARIVEFRHAAVESGYRHTSCGVQPNARKSIPVEAAGPRRRHRQRRTWDRSGPRADPPAQPRTGQQHR